MFIFSVSSFDIHEYKDKWFKQTFLKYRLIALCVLYIYAMSWEFSLVPQHRLSTLKFSIKTDLSAYASTVDSHII